MGFFDTIKDKAGDLAEDAGRAGKVGAAQVKLKSLQGDVKEAMEGLGREAFELAEKGELAHPGLEAALARIREAQKLVDEKKAEIEAIKAADD
jgi:hypothetical protein